MILLLIILITPIIVFVLILTSIFSFAHRHPRARPFIMGFMSVFFPEATAVFYAEMLVSRENVSKYELTQINNIINTQRAERPLNKLR